MKTKTTGSMILAAALLIWSPFSQARKGGDGVANGGNFQDLDFTVMAYEFQDALTRLQKRAPLVVPVNLNRLKAVIATATFRPRPGPMQLNGEEKHGINYPDLLLVRYDLGEFKAASFQRRKEMVPHELLPMVGIPDPGFHESLKLIKQIDSFKLWEPKNVPRIVRPQLLYSRFDDRSKDGLTLGQAQEICEQYKENHSEYFLVYCEFIEKTWGEMLPSERSRRRDHSFESSFKKGGMKWSEAARMIEESHTKTYEWAGDHSFGLKIYGLGQLEQLPWQLLVTSLNFGDGFGSRTFATRLAAQEACRNLIWRIDSQSLRYYRAVCRTAMDMENGSFYYEIVTQNPLISASWEEK